MNNDIKKPVYSLSNNLDAQARSDSNPGNAHKHDNDNDHATDPQRVPQSLRQSVEQSLTQYFNELDGQQPSALYDLFMQQVEAPLFECVMEHTQDNQSKAAALLGLNRGTLRKKLKQYDLL